MYAAYSEKSAMKTETGCTAINVENKKCFVKQNIFRNNETNLISVLMAKHDLYQSILDWCPWLMYDEEAAMALILDDAA